LCQDYIQVEALLSAAAHALALAIFPPSVPPATEQDAYVLSRQGKYNEAMEMMHEVGHAREREARERERERELEAAGEGTCRQLKVDSANFRNFSQQDLGFLSGLPPQVSFKFATALTHTSHV
jgi:hypothetical protein